MDSVRFGRALGFGARSAAKALVMAADAAAASKPASQAGAAATRLGERTGRAAVQTGEQVRQTRAGLARGGRRFGEAVWGPFVRLSGVLWLELTGVFFGLFLLTATISAWKLRGNLRETAANHAAHTQLLWSIAMALFFGYFCVSSFVRARRRESGRR